MGNVGASGSQPWLPTKITWRAFKTNTKQKHCCLDPDPELPNQLVWREQTSVFLKAPRWFYAQAGLGIWEGDGRVCPLGCPGHSGLHPPLPWLFMSLPVTWYNEGAPSSQKSSLTLRGGTTESSRTPQCQTSSLCNFEAKTLHSWNA